MNLCPERLKRAPVETLVGNVLVLVLGKRQEISLTHIFSPERERNAANDADYLFSIIVSVSIDLKLSGKRGEKKERNDCVRGRSRSPGKSTRERTQLGVSVCFSLERNEMEKKKKIKKKKNTRCRSRSRLGNCSESNPKSLNLR